MQRRGVAVVILEAGGSPRERSRLRHAVETALTSRCRPVVVVSDSSLRVTMEALDRCDDIEGTVIMLTDQPLVTADAVDRTVEAHYVTGKDIVASEYEDTCGVPLYMGRRFFGEIASLDGPHPARRIVDRHLEDVVTVPVAYAALDVDTPAVGSASPRR